MARREKKPVHKVVMTEGKRNIIQQLLQEYDIETAEEIQDALKDLLGGTIKEMMEAEMDDHLGYQKSEQSDNDDYRNGYKSKRVNSSYGSMDIDVPQDRKSTFEPQIVKKRQKALFQTLQIKSCLRSKTGCLRHSWHQHRREKEVFSITVGDNESSKYWLSVLNELKNRGVKDILIICADGLSGIKEAIAAAFPKTAYQRCIVHQVRNTLKYVPDKDRKAFDSDPKTICHASDEEKARLALDRVTEKWTMSIRNWGQVYGELSIMYEGRLPE